MPSSPPNGQRECTVCPAQVRACVHWDGQILVLTDKLRPSKLIVHPFRHPEQFGVALGSSWFTCPCHGDVVRSSAGYSYSLGFGDLPAAEAEFRRREAAMLGREES